MTDFLKNIISKGHQIIDLSEILIHSAQGNTHWQMTLSLKTLTLCQRVAQGTALFGVSTSKKNASSSRCRLPGMRLLRDHK